MTLRNQLLQDAQGYCDSKGISLSRLGNIVVNDGKFFERIKAGGDCTTGTFERFQAYFAENAPASDAA